MEVSEHFVPGLRLVGSLCTDEHMNEPGQLAGVMCSGRCGNERIFLARVIGCDAFGLY